MKKKYTLILSLIAIFAGLSLNSIAQRGIPGIGSKVKVGKGNGKGIDVNSKTIEAGTKVVKAATLTNEDIIEYTKEYVDWMDAHNEIAKDKDPQSKRLKKLVKNHKNVDGVELNYELYFVKDVNAFACADGSVRVCYGLMKEFTDDEILGVIGHEIGHVINHDSRDAFKTALLTSAFKDAAASQSGVAAALSETQLGDLAEAVANAQFSQKQESAADDYGFNFLKDNGYDVYAMGSAFRKLEKMEKEAGGGKRKQLLASHPGSGKRAKRMEDKADKELGK